VKETWIGPDEPGPVLVIVHLKMVELATPTADPVKLASVAASEVRVAESEESDPGLSAAESE
jgi:hypothetical protein